MRFESREGISGIAHGTRGIHGEGMRTFALGLASVRQEATGQDAMKTGRGLAWSHSSLRKAARFHQTPTMTAAARRNPQLGSCSEKIFQQDERLRGEVEPDVSIGLRYIALKPARSDIGLHPGIDQRGSTLRRALSWVVAHSSSRSIRIGPPAELDFILCIPRVPWAIVSSRFRLF